MYVEEVRGRLPEGTYVELVASLFATLLPTMIMAVSFLGVGLLIASQTPDALLAGLTVAGAIAAGARLTVLLTHRKRVSPDRLTLADACRFQRRFALAYLSFALVFGAFSARAFVVATPAAHMLVVGLLFGYGAGVAAGLSVRPWISIPSILIAIVPTIVTALMMRDGTARATAALLTIFLGGGIQSMVARYRDAVRQITMRRLFETLARSDTLTNLPNRLSLRERFDRCVATGDGQHIAVHCLDLDRFKPVNDRLGHPVGDALLKAVSERLQGLLRRDDFASRVGGDEFVVVQAAVDHAGEVEMLARRIARAIAQPYTIDGHEITIGTSIGYALSCEGKAELDRLMRQADEALCAVKRAGGGIAAHVPRSAEAEQRSEARVLSA